MPQPVQIVPNFRHPHNMVVINNNTWFDDSVAEAQYYGVSSVFVINSPKGEDRTIVPISRPTHYTEEFGVGTFNVHGQPYYNAYNFLSNNNDVLAYVMRVTAEDAAYSHVVIVANVRPDAANGKFEVYFEAIYLDDVRDHDELIRRAKALREDDTPDADGFFKYPVFFLRSSGRGVYGDNFRFRMYKETNMDEENNYLNYRMDVYEMEEYLKLKDAVKGSIYEEAIELFTTLYMQDTLNDFERGKVKMYSFQENLEDIYNLYVETVQPSVQVPYEQFDFFYGLDKEYDPIEGYTVYGPTFHDNAITLESAEGIVLSNGSDGIFAVQRTEAEKQAREAAIEDAYIKAFTGEFDRKILFKRQTPQTLFFDACYPEAVKYEIINWLINRHDGYGHLDVGLINTITDAIGWGEKLYNLGHITYGKSFQSYEVRDPFTNKKIRVTYPHFLAGNLPTHYMKAGEHIAYAAADAPLLGHVPRSVKPDLDADDSESKEALYILRMNYLETLAENVYQRGTQSTSDIGAKRTSWSDLNEENNVYVLLEYKRMLEKYVNTLTYDFAEAEDRAQFTSDCKRMLEPDIGVKVRSVNVRFDMTPWEEERSILHCYLEIVFKTMVKRSIIEIDVNPRV